MSAKNLQIKPISAKDANAFIRITHYSGKVVPNSQLHFGVFLAGRLEGVLQYGPSMRKEFMINLVDGTDWNEFIELNRMAFSDKLPRNSESRAIAITIKLIKKHYPHIKWIISFADACQCGDGTIYRASGFVLTGIKENTSLRRNPETGEIVHQVQAYHTMITQEFRNWEPLKGYQLRYMYFIDPECRRRLTVPIIPFSKIAEIGATMYLGQKSSGNGQTLP